MKVTFLGTGTSQGVPVINQTEDYGIDFDNPKNWRMRSSIHVKLGETHIQVDASPDFRWQCLRNSISAVDIFILTHSHADHIMGMDDLRRFCTLHGGAALPVYSTELGLRRIREIYDYAILDKASVSGYPAFSLEKMPSILTVPGGKIYSCLLPHGDLETLGLVFEEDATGKKFVYFTDCKSITTEAQILAAGAEVVVLDGLREKPHYSHMSINEACETAQKMNAPITLLTHINYDVDHAKTSAKLPPKVAIAYDGLSFEL